MKNKNLIIAAVVLILVVVFGGAYFMLSNKTKTTTPEGKQNTQTAKPQTVNKNAIRGTILSLLEGGKTVSCTINYPDNKGTGTVYVASNKQFAGDFAMKGADGKDTVGHMVSDGTFIYIWSANLPMGIKMNLAAAKNTANNAQTNQSVNVNENVDMQCGPWNVDNSKFTVPTNVKFTDFSSMVPQGAKPTTSVSPTTGTQTQGTSPCDQISDPTTKAACENALKGQ